MTHYHQVPTSTTFHWHSTIRYQPVPPSTDTAASRINQYRLPLTQYHRVPTNTALYWHSTIIYQPVPFYTDPVLQSTNQYRPILTQYHQVLTSTTFYWPSIKTSLFFFSSVKTIFPFSGYYPPFPPPFIVPSAKNIFLLHIFFSFFSFVDQRWAQLYVSLRRPVFPYSFVCLFVRPSRYGNIRPSLHFFQYMQA